MPRDQSRTGERGSGCTPAAGLDWRFLLPTPPSGSFRHLVLLGGGEGLAASAVRLGVARVVSRELPSDRLADAVIRLSGSGIDLAAAVACLEPGGVLYAEIDRHSRWSASTTPFAIRRALVRAGANAITIYWCRPGVATPTAYVPLAARGAVHWYLANQSAGSSGRRLRRCGLQAFASLGDAGAALLRRYAITAVAGGAGDVKASLLGHPDLPPQLRRDGLRLLLVAPPSRRVVLLPFTRTGNHPIAALKLTREASRNHRAEAEQRALVAVQRRVGGALASTIPQPYGCLRWGELVASVEGGMPGRLAAAGRYAGAKETRTTDVWRRVAAWLTTLHRETESGRPCWGDFAASGSADDLWREYERRFEPRPDEQALLEEVRRRSAELATVCVPLVWTHGDLHPGNVYLTDAGVGVIDWVDASDGPPVVDLCRFGVEWRAHLNGLRSERALAQNFREVFGRPARRDRLIAAIHEEISLYAAAIGLDQRLIPILIVAHWARRAVDHDRRGEGRASDTHRRLALRAAWSLGALALDTEAFLGRYGGAPPGPGMRSPLTDSGRAVRCS